LALFFCATPTTQTQDNKKGKWGYLSIEARHRAQRVVDAYEKFKAGNITEDALLEAVRDYVYRKLHRLETKSEGFADVGTAETVDDWTQDAMLKVWKYRESFKGQSGPEFLLWIKKIVHNKRCDAARYLTREKYTKVPLTLVGEDGDVYDNPILDTEAISYHDPRERRPWEVLIPEDIQGVDRKILERLVAGGSFAEAAYALGMSPQAVCNRMSRLKKKRGVLAWAETQAR
jgi:DNA-directed RNA polymerase specialized sigma24 family protein